MGAPEKMGSCLMGLVFVLSDNTLIEKCNEQKKNELNFCANVYTLLNGFDDWHYIAISKIRYINMSINSMFDYI